MNDWQSTLFHIFQILEITIKSIRAVSKIRKVIPREYTITEIKEDLQNGELHFGDKITVLGTFSEYLPFIDPKFLLKKGILFPKNLPRTARIEAINDIYCGALFPLDQKDAFA